MSNESASAGERAVESGLLQGVLRTDDNSPTHGQGLEELGEARSPLALRVLSESQGQLEGGARTRVPFDPPNTELCAVLHLQGDV